MAGLKKILSRLFTSRRPFKLTRAGWVFILYTIGVGAGAINTGNNLLYMVFGLFLGLLLASGVLSDLSLWRVGADFHFPVFANAGEPTLLPFHLTNHKKYFSSFSVVLEIEGALAGQTLLGKKHLPLIAPKEVAAGLLELTFPRRGFYQIQHMRLSTHYPFGLLKKWWRIHQDEMAPLTLCVLPQRRPVDFSLVERMSSGPEQEVLSQKRGEGVTLLGLRDYQYADHPRSIHWKASAKRTAMDSDRPFWMVREMEREEKAHLIIALPSPLDVGMWEEQRIETLVQWVYSLWEESKIMGREAQLVFSEDEGSVALVTDVARFLCLWNPQAPLDENTLTCLRRVPRESVLSQQSPLSAVGLTQAL